MPYAHHPLFGNWVRDLRGAAKATWSIVASLYVLLVAALFHHEISAWLDRLLPADSWLLGPLILLTGAYLLIQDHKSKINLKK